MPHRPKLSVVVPCFNEAEVLTELHSRLSKACKSVVGDSYEVIVVNDGSADKSWQILRDLVKDDPNLIGVSLSRNHGHQIALTAGLKVSTGERVFILDADLQDPPELLREMMAKMDEGFDVVYGKRIIREGETIFKRASAYFFYRFIQRLVDIEIPRDTGDFRIMSRRAVDVLLSMPEHFRFVRGLVSLVGFRQTALPYRRVERFAGTTKYPLRAMLRFALDAITSFSVRPLRIASYLGLVAGLGAIVLLIIVVWSWIYLDVIQGWTSVMLVVLALSSAQLFILGLMGEYIGRTYLESKRRPLFVIDEIIVGPDSSRPDLSPEMSSDLRESP